MGIVGDYLLLRQSLSIRRRHSLHFIVGVPRSGTSLCRMLLGSHRRILAPSETPWIFGAYGDDIISLDAFVRVLCTSQYGPVKSIAGISAEDIHLAAERFILAVFDSKMRADRKNVLILKTPDDIAFIDEILRVFSRSIVIHVRRDVRDVALSTVKTGWHNLNLFGENSFENCVRRWIAWERRLEAAKARHPDRIISLRFEDLVVRPAMTLSHVLQMLQLRFDRAMLSYWEHSHGAPEWDLGSRNAAEFINIESARAFAYRKHTPTDEQRMIIARHDSDIAALGYPAGWGE